MSTTKINKTQNSKGDSTNIHESKLLSEEFTPSENISVHDVSEELNKIRLRNVNNVIIGHLNVNSIQGKIDSLRLMIPGNIDIMVISETKIDDSFPNSQFKIEGFGTPFRKDRTENGGDVIIYVREDIPKVIPML